MANAKAKTAVTATPAAPAIDMAGMMAMMQQMIAAQAAPAPKAVAAPKATVSPQWLDLELGACLEVKDGTGRKLYIRRGRGGTTVTTNDPVLWVKSK